MSDDDKNTHCLDCGDEVTDLKHGYCRDCLVLLRMIWEESLDDDNEDKPKGYLM
jgi:hypothetical protein